LVYPEKRKKVKESKNTPIIEEEKAKVPRVCPLAQLDRDCKRMEGIFSFIGNGRPVVSVPKARSMSNQFVH